MYRFVLFSLAAAVWAAPKPVDFDREIRPVLADTCFACHGPDEKQRQAKLRLDTKDGASKVIASGALYQRISAANPAIRMPPGGADRTLTSAQIERIRQWIDEGAKWETHWAYVAPRRPDPPVVRDAGWARNPIDGFVSSRLEKEGLKPSPEAPRATLLRRVTLDLTGLPPTLEEVSAFLADRSPDAYERVVDRLLHSPRYGERMAMQWLDLARYSDTHGYHIDSHRDMWPWRDWLIASFNRNQPYDQFTIEQLAGDLLPNATREQKIASGFNRNHMINFEGGAIPEEYQVEYVVDRVETTAAAFMGTTLGCARCHDHKYDPIAQKDFYRFFAFFNTIPEKGLDGRAGNAEPTLQLPDPAQEQRLAELKREIAARAALLPDIGIAILQLPWEKTVALPEPSREGLEAHYEMDGNLNDSSGHYRHGRVLDGEVTYNAGMVARSAAFDGSAEVVFPGFTAGERMTLSAWVKLNGSLPAQVLRVAGISLAMDRPVAIGDLKLGAHLILGREGATLVQTRDRLATNEWTHIAAVWDGQWTLYVDGKPRELKQGTGDRGQGTGTAAPGGRSSERWKSTLDDVRVYSRPLTSEEVEPLRVHEPARATLAMAPAKRSKEQKQRLAEYFLVHAAPEPQRKAYAELTAFKAEKTSLDKIIPTVMTMREMEKPRETWVLGRGDYRNHGERVTPDVPAMLPPLPKDAPRNRLTLARWLVDPSHPLTARVAVNRYWQMYFGTGIVKTAEDFGSQGEAPVHPELLDWLATEFIRTGWDVRAMQRMIVTSATYRQSSKVTPELLERDPENRLWARGPRFRLPAETVRDNALAVSGLLYEKTGGPSVFPYQPPGLWEEMAFGDVYSAQTYVQSHGQDLYRRSMYTFWKRTVPPASLSTFDAPDREKCTARRPVTNTPLQALVLWNDPTYVEAARALAGRMLNAGRDPAARLRFGFRLATGREPLTGELDVLRETLREQGSHYAANPDAAAKLVHVGESPVDPKVDTRELAAWTMVASVLLTLDETISKE